MTSSYYKLKVENRPITGKKTARKLRDKGIIPGVLYYKGEEPIQIAVDKLIMYHAIHSGQRIYEIDGPPPEIDSSREQFIEGWRKAAEEETMVMDELLGSIYDSINSK